MGKNQFSRVISGKIVAVSAKRLLAGVVLALFLLPLLVGFTGIKPAMAGETAKPKVIMIIVNRVTLEDMTDDRYENIKRLMALGGLGLMVINTGSDYTDINSYVSLGGGDKLIGSALAGESYNREEILRDGSKAYEVYSRNTGNQPRASRVLNTSVPASLKANEKRYTVSAPGQLGTILHKSGLRTAVIGNSDLAPEDEPNRLAVTIAMDGLGLVDEGNVSRDVLVNDSGSPYGWRTDYDKLIIELDRVSAGSDFVVVETGDTIRANSNSDRQSKNMAEYHRHRALQGVDGLIGSLLERGYLQKGQKNTMVMVVTPLPHAQALRDGIRLTPLIIAGGPITAGSILTSPGTRQKGLVANYDVTATVAAHLGTGQAEGIIGLPVQSFREDRATPQTGYTAGMYNWLTANSRQRAGVLFYFIRYQWIVYGLVFLQIVFRYFRRIKLARVLLAGILLYPLAILLVPLTGSFHPWLTIFLSLALLALITYLLTRMRNDLKLYFAIAVVTVVPSIVDILTGGNLMKKAALSYDLAAGGRFYGIGNEYMGVIIGAAILGSAALLQLLPEARKRLIPVIGLVFTGLILFFAAPAAGTNAGGALAAIIGFAVAADRFLGRKVKLRPWLLPAVVLAVGIGILIAANNLVSSGPPSHIGRSVNDLFRGNIPAVWQTVQRKLAANFYLLRNSPFSMVLILQLLLWGRLFLRNRSQMDALYKQMPFLQAGLTGMFFGAVAAFAFNDSGVIAAALLLNYLIVPLVSQVLRIVQETGGQNV